MVIQEEKEDGTITLTANKFIYAFVGGAGKTGPNGAGTVEGGFNGGGSGGSQQTNRIGGSGGGGSDFRIGGNTVNSRVIVAGGGGRWRVSECARWLWRRLYGRLG